MLMMILWWLDIISYLFVAEIEKIRVIIQIQNKNYPQHHFQG